VLTSIVIVDNTCIEHVQVYTSLQAVESALDSASREIFVARVFGAPCYLPRGFAALCCARRRRPFPRAEVQVRLWPRTCVPAPEAAEHPSDVVLAVPYVSRTIHASAHGAAMNCFCEPGGTRHTRCELVLTKRRACVQAVCAAVRGVARIQLSLHSLFEDGLSTSMAAVLRERFPPELLPRLVEFSANIIEAHPLSLFVHIQNFALLHERACDKAFL
jgi:hypothetical protein